MMDALHINTSTNSLLFGDLPDLSHISDPPRDAASPLQLNTSSGGPATRHKASSEAGITSAHSNSHSHPHSHSHSHSHSHPHSRTRLNPRPGGLPLSSSTYIPSSSSTLFPFAPAPQQPAAAFGTTGRESRPGTAVSGTGTFSPSPLFFGPGHRTTPETSLVGASGEYITTVDDSTVAHRTSALRELNSSFPSPVFRHRHTKSTGAQSATYSQPVIVRTYTGPSNSPSTSKHNRRPSSSRRTDSRVAVSRRIPLVSSSRPGTAFTTAPAATASTTASNSPDNAAGSGAWGLTHSFFGMARSKVKKGGFLPWSWSSNNNAPAPDEAKLPPIEAFTFKGFMADLQTNTDIRSDLDRIAEICARSRYSLSNQYEAHMAPHGSGASFAAPTGQSRSKSWMKGTSSPSGPTLQAVPSDDDESTHRTQRRRRGGIGGGKRRSAAYGTLETIMSSSRSSEEDKTKKKPAAEIADEVRGRPARKAIQADANAVTGDTGSSGFERSSGSGSGPTSGYAKGHRRTGTNTSGVDADSETGAGKREKGKAVQRPRSTTFAHAVIHGSRHQAKRLGSKEDASSEKTKSDAGGPAGSRLAVPALLGEPALPYTTDGSTDVYSASGSAAAHSVARGGTRVERASPSSTPGRARLATRTHRPDLPVHVVNEGADGDEQASQLLTLSPEDAAEQGFLSGLTHWIPWATSSNGMPEPLPTSGQHSQHGQAPRSQPRPDDGVEAGAVDASGRSHAEGSLRELLRNIEASNMQDKGKVADADG